MSISRADNTNNKEWSRNKLCSSGEHESASYFLTIPKFSKRHKKILID